MNRICLIGRLVADPQLRYSSSGTAVTTFRIAVDRPFTAKNGEKEADFIDCIAFRKLGEVVANNLAKGRLVGVDGRLQIREYEHQGQRRRVAEVVADTVQFLDRSKEESSPSGRGTRRQQDDDDGFKPDDVPF